MFHINLNRKIFWIVAVLIVFSNALLTYTMYKKNQEMIEVRALSKGNNLKNYFISMRNIYHHQFLNSGVDLNDTTIGFLPAHASTLISDKFAELSEDGTTIRNVTDRARNPKNKADKFELEAIEYFKNNPNKTTLMKKIEHNGMDFFNFTSPLIIEPYCIACHGKKEETLASIQERYDNAYDYKVGDIRGVTSIKIPSEKLTNESMHSFYNIAIFSWITILFLLILIYYTIKKLTIKDVEQKMILQNEVKIKTADLEEQKNELKVANIKQQHLFSILRTVADCNQILITAKNIDELIQNTAVSMHSNTSFASIKILIFEDGKLRVKSSIGLDEEMEVLPIEEDVFKNNHNVFLKNFDKSMPQECLDKIKRHNITEIYALPLRKEHYSKEALGAMIICSTEENGLSIEERNMINELAGDIGFAINSFYQKDAINQLSYYDQLTNLPNQNLFEQHLNQALLKSSETLKYGAVLFLDFDDFKNVNNLMGKDIGDEVLKEMASRLVSRTDKTSMISRFGSDKFLLLIEDLSSDEKESAIISKQFAQKTVALAKEPFILNNKTFHLTCSIGIVLFFDHRTLSETILNQAEYAMRVAKDSGKNVIKFYNQTLQDMTNLRSLMLQNLKEAVLEHQFVLYYQKQVDSNANVMGVEALIRWQHPNLGFISPGEFIPLAEESDIIKDIGAFVLNEATNLIIKWADDTIKKEWRISVNISPKQFRDETFVDNIKNLIISKNIDPKKLRVELTESVLIDNQQSAMQKIDELNRFGVSISIDDFGTGYSSLGYLKHLSIDELKIDQSFVLGLSENSSDKTIIKTILTMGEEFGFEVIAEGVETKEQFEELKNLGCNYFQGYLFAKPCPEKEL